MEDGGEGKFDPEDYILFYGQSPNRFEWDDTAHQFSYIKNPYDTLSCYWLRWNATTGKRIEVKNASPVTPGAFLKNIATQYIHLEKDKFNPLKSGVTWTWNLFGSNNLFIYTFDLNDLAGTQASVQARIINYMFYWYIYTGDVYFNFNTHTIGPLQADHEVFINSTFPVLNTGNILEVGYQPVVPWDTLKQVGLDWVDIAYPAHTYLIGSGKSIFVEPANGIFHFTYNKIFPPDSIDIYDVSNPVDVKKLITVSDSLFEDTLSLEDKTYFVLKKSAAKSVLDIIPAQRGLIQANDGADYVMITPGQFESALFPLKTHRETHDNLNVKIVTTEDIFDEFGFGRRDPTAIRNFIRFAHANWNPQPRYVLLAGNGYYDYLNLTGEYPANWVPPFEIDGTSLVSRAVDDYFVDVNFGRTTKVLLKTGAGIFLDLLGGILNPTIGDRESEALTNFDFISPDIAIGRLPANDLSELNILVQKIIDSETNFKPGLWRLSSLLIADDQNPGIPGNEWFFLLDMEMFANNILPAENRERKLYEADYPLVNNEKPAATQQLINWINNGNRLIIFTGHSMDGQWTHENLLNVNRDISSIRNDGMLSFFPGIGQLFKYDDIHPGIASELLKKENSGFFGIVTASRPVYANAGRNFILLFLHNIFGATNVYVGDAFIQAKLSNIHYQKFSLLGDPASMVSFPPHRIQINSIAPDTLKARSLVHITGQINGSAPGDSLIVEVREPGKIKHQRNNSIRYEATGNAIFRGIVPVSNGQFMLQFVVPDDVPHDSVVARGKLFAYTWNGLSEGMGFKDSLLFGGMDSTTVDVTPPQISLSVTDSDTISPRGYLNADLYDESGINLSLLGNHYPMIFLDGNLQDTINVSDFYTYSNGSYQSGKILYPLPYLTGGEHSIILKVHDNYNNAATDSIRFVVTGINPPPGRIPEEITLFQNYPNPFNPNTTIRFKLAGNSLYEVKLEIYNVLGQKVKALVDNTMLAGEYRIVWDGTNTAGNAVASGVYIYRLWASSHSPAGFSQQRGGIYQQSRKMLLVR